MAGRHVHRQRGVRIPLLVAAVALLATGTVVVVQSLADARGCSRDSGVEVTVAADPAIAPALREVANDWLATAEPELDGRCVGIDVIAATTADVASVLASSVGGSVDVATPSPAPGRLDDPPAVWVPDSSYWITELRSVNRNLFLPEQRSLATTPVVIGASPEAAAVLGPGPVTPEALATLVVADLPLAVADPRRDTAGLVGAGWLRQAMAPDEADLPAAVALFRGLGAVPPDSATLLRTLGDDVAAAPVSEQAVLAHNASQPLVPVTAVAVSDAPVLDFPYTVVAGALSAVQTAAGMFATALFGSGDLLTRHGFRAVDGTAQPGFRIGNGVTGEPVPVAPVGPPELVAPLLRVWISSRSDARVLSIVNVTESMLLPMGEGPIRRIDVFQATAGRGIELFTPNSQLGHWEYADGWEEGVPVATLTDDHKARILAEVSTLELQSTNRTALFDTLLAAYQALKDGYDPTRSNTLLLWTDGGDNVPDGRTLEQTLRELERLVDLTRPIRVILLGLGPDADMTQLTAIADAVGGGAYQLLDPAEIELIFLQALLT